MEGLKTLAQRWNIPSLNSSLIPGLPLYKFYARDTRGRVSRTLDITIVILGLIIGVVLVFLMTKMFIGGKML